MARVIGADASHEAIAKSPNFQVAWLLKSNEGKIMRSIYDNIVVGSQVSVSINGISVVTSTGVAFDTKLYSSAELSAHVEKGSVGTSSTGVAYLTESATVGGTYTPALYSDGTPISVPITGFYSGGAAQNVATRIEGLGQNRMRFLKANLAITPGAGGQTTTGYAEIIAGRSQYNPTQTGGSIAA